MIRFPNSQSELMDVIGFNEEDLEANRAGYLSKRQRAALRRVRRGWLDWSSITVIFCALGSVFTVLDGLRVGDKLERRTITVGIICIATAVVFTSCHRRLQQCQADLWKGDVASVVGRIALTSLEGRYGTKYTIRVDRKTFALDQLVFCAFQQDERYALYYCPHIGKLLSAEATPTRKAKKSKSV